MHWQIKECVRCNGPIPRQLIGTTLWCTAKCRNRSRTEARRSGLPWRNMDRLPAYLFLESCEAPDPSVENAQRNRALAEIRGGSFHFVGEFSGDRDAMVDCLQRMGARIWHEIKPRLHYLVVGGRTSIEVRKDVESRVAHQRDVAGGCTKVLTEEELTAFVFQALGIDIDEES